MSNVIDFLERIGTDPKLLNATAEEMEAALVHADIAPAVRSAILTKNQIQLETLLDAPTNVCCMIEAVDMGDDSPSTNAASVLSFGSKRGSTAN